MFTIPDGRYTVFVADIGWKHGTPVQIDDEHSLPISAIYPTVENHEGIGVNQMDAIRDAANIKRIIADGMKHEPPLKEFFLMACDWITEGVLSDRR